MPSIDTLPIERVQDSVRELSSQAIQDADLSLVFGSNGKSGRSATGNFSLLARATGLSRVHVGKVLKGQAVPSYKTLMKLSEATGISLDRISAYIQEQKKEKRAA